MEEERKQQEIMTDIMNELNDRDISIFDIVSVTIKGINSNGDLDQFEIIFLEGEE